MDGASAPHDRIHVVLSRRRLRLNARWSKLLLLLLLLLNWILHWAESRVVVFHAMLAHPEPPTSCDAGIED